MPLGPRRESPVALPALPPLYLLRTRSTPRSRRLRPPPRPARRRFRRELRLYLLRTRSRLILRRLRRLLLRLPTRKPKPAKAALSVKRAPHLLQRSTTAGSRSRPSRPPPRRLRLRRRRRTRGSRFLRSTRHKPSGTRAT